MKLKKHIPILIIGGLVGSILGAGAMYLRASHNIQNTANYFEKEIARLENEKIVDKYSPKEYDTSKTRLAAIQNTKTIKSESELIQNYYSLLNNNNFEDAYAMRADQQVDYDEYVSWYDDVSIWASIKQRNISGNYDVNVLLYNNETKTSEIYDVELAVTEDGKINTIRSVLKEPKEQLQSAQIDGELVRIEIVPNQESEDEVGEKLFLVKGDERILLDSTDAWFGRFRARIDIQQGWIIYSKNYHEGFSNHIYDIGKYRTINLGPGNIDAYTTDGKYLYSCFPNGMPGMAFTIVDREAFDVVYKASYEGNEVSTCLPYDAITNTVSYLGQPVQGKQQEIHVYDFNTKRVR